MQKTVSSPQPKSGEVAVIEADLRTLFAFVASRVSLAAVAGIGALILFARFSAEFNRHGKLQAFDRYLLALSHAHQHGPLHLFAYWVSYVSSPVAQISFVCLAAVAFAVSGRIWPQSAAILLAALGGAGLVSCLKFAFHRPRPELIFAPLGYSFPSGHTFFAVVVYGMVAYWIAREVATRKLRRLIWGVAVTAMFLVGSSRVYLGEHYPSDVGAGYSIGIAWLWLCLTVGSRVWHSALARKAARSGANRTGASASV